MASIQEKIAQAKAAGYSDAEIAKYLGGIPDISPKIKAATDAGYKPEEIIAHLSGTALKKSEAPDPTKGGLPFRPFGVDTGLTMPEGVSNFAAGVGKSIVDAGRGIGQLVGAVSRDDVAESRRLDAPLMKTGAGMAGDIVGNVGMAFLPGGALKGVAMGANAFNATRAAAPVISAVGSALLAPKTIKGAAALGAGMGLIQPSTSGLETLQNTVLGGAASSAVPIAVRGFQATRAAAEPFYEEGQKRILGRAIQAAAGGDDAAIANIKAAAQPFVGPSPEGLPVRTIMGEIVPGAIPTVAQAARNPSLAALERTASQTDPIVSTQFGRRMAAQNEARLNALQNLAGTDGARMFAEAERNATAQQLYKQAYDLGIDPALLTPARRGEITKLLKTPAIQQAIKDAKTLLANDMRSVKNPSGSVEGLDYVKRALDDQIAKASPNEARILAGLKDRLLTTVDTLSPEYAAARKVYRDMSVPLNQMDTAAEIANKSINKLTGRMEPAAFARNFTDDAAARATGFQGATLENTFEPSQLNALTALKDDLANAAFAQSAGKNGSDTVQKLAYSNMLAEAGVPNWLRNLAPAQFAGNVAARVGDAAYGRANKELSNRLAMSLLDPQTAAELLQKSIRNDNALMTLARGGAVAGLALPRLVNVNQ